MSARRSPLSVPGSSERMLAKASTLGADEIVVDLEDAVAAGAKEEARELVARFLTRSHGARRSIAVRVNALTSEWGEQDVVELVQCAGPRIGSLVIPKVERAEQVEEVEELLDAQGHHARGIRLQALIETAAGLLHVSGIADGSARLDSLILGYADLAASLGRAPTVLPPDAWLYAQEAVLVAARAYGLQAIDGPYLEIRDDEGLRLRARHARTLGFDGKWAVHPGQLAIINEAFTPTASEAARAQAILDALDRAEGRGAVEVDGAMVDEASRKLAEQVAARARAAGLEKAAT